MNAKAIVVDADVVDIMDAPAGSTAKTAEAIIAAAVALGIAVYNAVS